MYVPDVTTSSSSSDDSDRKKGARTAGRSLNEAGQRMMAKAGERAASSADSIIASMKRGGKVRKTGNYKLHRGETVKPARKGKSRGKKGRGGKGRY